MLCAAFVFMHLAAQHLAARRVFRVKWFHRMLTQVPESYVSQSQRMCEAISGACLHLLGHVVVRLVEALRYKPEGRSFDSQWYHWNFSLT